jgi:hypothetical protein
MIFTLNISTDDAEISKKDYEALFEKFCNSEEVSLTVVGIPVDFTHSAEPSRMNLAVHIMPMEIRLKHES